MPNSRKSTKLTGKRRALVEELEEVQKVDRRGNVRLRMQPMRKDPPLPKRMLPQSQKRARWKSPSPEASGSNDYFQKPKTSKVRTVWTYYICKLKLLNRTRTTFSENGWPKGSPFCNICLNWKDNQMMACAVNADQEMGTFAVQTASVT